MQVDDAGNFNLPQVFFKHFASNQRPGLSVSGTLVENRLILFLEKKHLQFAKTVGLHLKTVGYLRNLSYVLLRPSLLTIRKSFVQPRLDYNDIYDQDICGDTYVCVSWGRKCSFFGKFGVLCFLVTYVLKFVLLPNHRRIDPLNVVVCVIYTPFSFFSFFFPQEYCKLISGDSVFSLLCMC